MSRPQSAILPPASEHATFMTLDLDGEATTNAVATGIARVPELTRELAVEYPESELHSAVGIGAKAWSDLFESPAPAGLEPFTPIDGRYQAPATQTDLFIHIHSGRADLNYELGNRILAALGPGVAVVEAINTFRYLDSRDMTGFVDGTENPEGDERAEVALVADGEHAGGSYVSIQRYVHSMAAWNATSVSAQEKVIGRTKADDIELEGDAKPASAHISRVVIKEDGEELEILRHSMPWGTPGESGLYFVAYANNPDNFRRMLNRMHAIGGDSETTDGLLAYTQAVTGASFFVPSLEGLTALTRR